MNIITQEAKKRQSLAERSHRPKSHSKQHNPEEEAIIRQAVKEKFFRYGWDSAYDEAVKNGYTRSFSGMVLCGLVRASKEKSRLGSMTGDIRNY